MMPLGCNREGTNATKNVEKDFGFFVTFRVFEDFVG